MKPVADYKFNKRWTFGRWYVKAYMREGDGMVGRLGGGWKWKLALLVGSSEIVLELFVMCVRIGRTRVPV